MWPSIQQTSLSPDDRIITVTSRGPQLYWEWGVHTFSKNPGILGARRATWSKLNTADPQVLDATIQNLVTQLTWHPEFMHPCWEPLCLVLYFFIYEVRLLGLLLMLFPPCNSSIFTLPPRLQCLYSGLALETLFFWVSCWKLPTFVPHIFLKSVWLHHISCHGGRQTWHHPAVARLAFCSDDCFYTCPWFGQHSV